MQAASYLKSPTVLLIFFGCLLATLILTPWVVRLAHRMGAVDAGGHRKVYQGKPMPLLGGIGIAIPFIAVCIAGSLQPTKMFKLIADRDLGLIVLAVASTLIVCLGVFDDRFGLKARPKFLAQIALAVMVGLSGHLIRSIDVPFVGLVVLPTSVSWVLTVGWIVGLTNAYNLIDGIDGLASGLGAIAALGLATIAAVNGAIFPMLLCLALAGSLLGFLRYNFHPAKIFLGDTGSMFIGFTLASIALMSSMKSSGTLMFVMPLAMLLGLPIMDTLSSMLRRWLRGRPIFTGDQGHLHHRLLRKGYSHRRVALTLYGISLLMALTSIVYVLVPFESIASVGVLACYGLAAVGLAWVADYTRLDIFMKLPGMRRRNQMLNAFARYAALKLTTGQGSPTMKPADVLWVICRELSLSRLEVVREDGEPLLEYVDPAVDFEETNRQATREMRVHMPTGDILLVRYVHAHPMDEYEENDLQACLANIFEETRMVLPWIAPAVWVKGRSATDVSEKVHELSA